MSEVLAVNLASLTIEQLQAIVGTSGLDNNIRTEAAMLAGLREEVDSGFLVPTNPGEVADTEWVELVVPTDARILQEIIAST